MSKPTNVAEDHRQPIEQLWGFYVAADGLPIRKIADVIAERDEDR
ncbi:hypothetical protein P3102_10930 [Amycolatopsis sp. QT-25]|nr:hypothetical protein [Amycolatopsis sp. QT-25]WET81677.1 hypothetical protein P3102_10930 [Amycolatopsis sp. QT-25]